MKTTGMLFSEKLLTLQFEFSITNESKVTKQFINLVRWFFVIRSCYVQSFAK